MTTRKHHVMCPACKCGCDLVGGKEIYPHRPDLFEKFFYLCPVCSAYVGCHPGTQDPLGRPAGKELRVARNRVHARFDPLWKSGQFKRKEAYAWLATAMDMPKKRCHIGMFNESECLRALALLGGFNYAQQTGR